MPAEHQPTQRPDPSPPPRRFRRASAAAGAAITALGAVGVGAVAGQQAASAATGGFTVTGALATARAHAATAVLHGGDVLVAGGQDAKGDPLASVERYDPGSGKWTTLADLPLPVTDATATVLTNGDVLVAGGLTAAGSGVKPTGASEVFDPAHDSWSSVEQLPTATYDAAAVRVANGDVLYAGGFNATGSSATATSASALYDPGTQKWTTTDALPTGVARAAAAPVGNGDALVAGGMTSGAGAVSGAAARFDAASGKWTTLADMPTPAADAAVVVLSDGRVLVAGGRLGSGAATGATRLFDPAHDSWTTAGALPAATYAAAAAQLGTGPVLLAGGMTTATHATRAAALFDPSKGTWSSTAPLAAPAAYAASAPVGAADALVAGGETGAGVTNESEQYIGGNSPVITTPASVLVNHERYASFTIRASGTPTPTLTLAGALPRGMVFHAGSDGTATISGRPEVGPGTYTVAISANNGVGAPVVQHLAITVAAVPRFTTPATVGMHAGSYLSFTIRTSGAPTPTLRLAGQLPPGLVFHPASNGTATISGTPAAGAHPTYEVSVVANNGVGGDVVQRLSLTYNAAPALVSAPHQVSVLDGKPVSFSFKASGTPAPRWSLSGRLPAGLGFHPAGNGTATISGTARPGQSGTFAVTLRASNGAGPAVVDHLQIVARLANNPRGLGYYYVTSTGTVIGKGAARTVAPRSPQNPRQIVAMAEMPDHGGYYLASAFGGVFAYGDALFKGSITHLHLRTPVVALALAPGGNGYYLVTRRGNVFNFGGGRFYGSLAARRTAPIASFALTPDGHGYWLVTTTGAVYAFGDAHFYGAPAGRLRNVAAFAPTPDGHGYWLVTANGHVLHYGNAGFFGSLAGRRVPPVTGFAPSGDGHGYWLVTRRGNVFNFGDATFFGSSAHSRLPGAIEGFAPEF